MAAQFNAHRKPVLIVQHAPHEHPAAVRRALESQGILSQVIHPYRGEHYPGQLSGGEQQRVALARAMAPRPQILFADEPTGNLDSTNGEAIADLLFALNAERGSTLFLVTHEEQLARRCQRMLRMADGKIVSGAPHASTGSA